MARKNLTARFVDAVSVETRTDFWDDGVRGLVLRVSPTGVKSWNAVYSRESDGAKRRVTIGKYPAITLEKARSKALAVMSAVSEGNDPAGAKRARREAMTVMELGELFIDKYAKRTKRTWAEDERILKVDVYPAIGGMKAMAVKRRDILDVIDAKADAGRLAQSTQVLAVVRKLFGWAVENDYLESSPVSGVKPRAKPVKRDRVLTDEEVTKILKALPLAAISTDTREILMLLLLTGQRSGEVCGMRRAEIDTTKLAWTIPASRTKNGLAHVVPLSDDALTVVNSALTSVKDEEGDPALYSRIGDPIESNAIAQAVRKKLQVTGERWTPHDIRRTVATGMAGLGVQPHVIEAVLNHISGFRAGVAGIYNRNTYEPEKRRALDLWASHLGTLQGKQHAQILPLRRAADD